MTDRHCSGGRVWLVAAEGHGRKSGAGPVHAHLTETGCAWLGSCEVMFRPGWLEGKATASRCANSPIGIIECHVLCLANGSPELGRPSDSSRVTH